MLYEAARVMLRRSAKWSWLKRRALSPTFRAGELVFFIPLRVVAEESGAAHRPAWARRRCRFPFWFRFGATMELGDRATDDAAAAGVGPQWPWPARRAYRVTH
jgi:hypothetical protein